MDTENNAVMGENSNELPVECKDVVNSEHTDNGISNGEKPLFEVTYVLNEETYKRILRSSPVNKKLQRALALLAIVLILRIYKHPVFNSWEVYCLCFVIVFPIALLIGRRKNIANFKNNKRLYNKETHLKFYKDRFTGESPNGYTIHPYDEMTKIKETKECFLFYTSKYSYSFISKADCSDELIEFLRTIMQTKR